MPPYAPLVHDTCDELAQQYLLLPEDGRPICDAHHEACAAGDAIGWPALQCLGRELGELADRLG